MRRSSWPNQVTGDATALARLVPPNAPTDTAGRGKAFITAFGQRAFRRPLTTAEVTTHVGPVQSGADALSRGRRLQGGRQPGDPGDAAIALLPLPDRARDGRGRRDARWRSTTGRSAPSWRSRSPTRSRTTRCWRRPRPGSCTTRPAWPTQAKRLLDGTTGTAGISNFNLQIYRLGAYDGIIRDTDGVPRLHAEHPGGDEAGGAAVPRAGSSRRTAGSRTSTRRRSGSWTRCSRRSTA